MNDATNTYRLIVRRRALTSCQFIELQTAVKTHQANTSQSEYVSIWFGQIALHASAKTKEYGTRKVSRNMMKHDETSKKVGSV